MRAGTCAVAGSYCGNDTVLDALDGATGLSVMDSSWTSSADDGYYGDCTGTYCSYFHYTNPSPYPTVIDIAEKCIGALPGANVWCSGRVAYYFTGNNNASPALPPPRAPPPPAMPSSTAYSTCTSFSLSGKNFVDCVFSVPAYTGMTASTCPNTMANATCTGQTQLIISSSLGQIVGVNTTIPGCNGCSYAQGLANPTGSTILAYVRQSCAAGSCTGTTAIALYPAAGLSPPSQSSPPPPSSPSVTGAPLGTLVACPGVAHHNAGPAFLDMAPSSWGAVIVGTVAYGAQGLMLNGNGGLMFNQQPGGVAGVTVMARVARNAAAAGQTILVHGGVAVVTTTNGGIKLVRL
jgi:hypothetical protein